MPLAGWLARSLATVFGAEFFCKIINCKGTLSFS